MAAAERLEPQLSTGTAEVQNVGSTETLKPPAGTWEDSSTKTHQAALASRGKAPSLQSQLGATGAAGLSWQRHSPLTPELGAGLQIQIEPAASKQLPQNLHLSLPPH